MNIVIASDLHGAKKPVERLKEIVEREKPEALLLLGDLLYHGPRNDLPESYCPKEVIRLLSEMKDIIISVRGNCEAEVDQMVLPFSCMSDSNMLIADKKRIFMTHGHVFSFEKHPDNIDVIMQGHTHLPVLRRENGVIWLNPGSTSIPKGGNPPSYAIWDCKKIEIRELYSDVVISCLEIQE